MVFGDGGGRRLGAARGEIRPREGHDGRRRGGGDRGRETAGGRREEEDKGNLGSSKKMVMFVKCNGME